MRNILVVTTDSEVLHAMAECFVPESWVEQASEREEARGLLKRLSYDLVFIDLDILWDPNRTGSATEALQAFWQVNPGVEIHVMCPASRVRDAVACVKAGAAGYFTRPLSPEQLAEATGGDGGGNPPRGPAVAGAAPDALSFVQTNSPRMRAAVDDLRQVAPTDSTVLLTGETGTGKGLMSRLLHKHSNRGGAPFVSVHCGAIPETLLESELFGHEKGAFTGAVKRRLGRFELAGEGTLVLDEIGTIPQAAQVKLLQVLQEGVFHRVGGEQPIRSRARVVAATNMDLLQMCEDGVFRRDLYYRLNVFPVEMPPLRERLEDLPILADNFLGILNARSEKRVNGVSDEAMAILANYPWPGNIRELENVLERAYILEKGDMLTPASLPRDLRSRNNGPCTPTPDLSLPLSEARRKALDEVEVRYLRALLARHRGRINETAENAGISTRYLHKLMARHGLDKDEFK